MADSQDEPLINGGEAPMQKRRSSRWLKRNFIIIMLFAGTTTLLFWVFGTPSLGRPTQDSPTYGSDGDLIVTLPGYGSFQGIKVVSNLPQTTNFSTPVDAWLGVDYSTQPVGEDRFKPVTWPAAFDGVKNATTYGPACWQNVYSSTLQSEACLNLNVFRPSGVPLDQKLPIFIFIHGGSFVSGSSKSFDGAMFVARSAQPVMVITMQYRLGAIGNIPSKLMQEEDGLNLGVRDQRQMLEFVQKYADSFGGDKDRVTLGGLSAGGHSVGIHLFHNYGEDTGKPLFAQAILASGSPTARAFPGVDYALYQRQFADFMDYLNCPTTPNDAAMACLRAADVDDLQFMSSALYSASNYNITWPWQPVSPGPLIEKRGSTSGEDGTFFKIPILISSATNDGSPFAPQDLRTNAEFVKFWQNLAPGLTAADLEDVQRLYPDPTTYGAQSPFLPVTEDYISPQFQRISAAYGDYSYTCPVQDTASRLAAAGAPVYKARFNTPNWTPTYLGAPHASDNGYYNGQVGTQYPEIAEIYSAYFASFVVSGDPNTYADSRAPKWEIYTGTGGNQLVVSPPAQGGAQMEVEAAGIRMEQCAWWRDEDRAKRLNK
ncbi:alpha/beta-hydrolase [Didymella exigua CBS 183.55]|uniref:Carboxylic ester hydrolase n=1 Tax=Didymella exigua CBS 183.55 TaxID=1150837 RepID=A0A6A5RJ80_9PLEO|nr:alpha/beta-hydrolase [Didymella exigua CBS 183.55]KAF1927310.1 alpha/beta-hydrolase [Didymella exigua CBS 183.55]